MSTLTEVETAIDGLSESDREVLESRILARRFGLDALDSDEHAGFMRSLEEAEEEIDAGEGRSADQLRRSLP